MLQSELLECKAKVENEVTLLDAKQKVGHDVTLVYYTKAIAVQRHQVWRDLVHRNALNILHLQC